MMKNKLIDDHKNWATELQQIAELCEKKNCRLYYDELQEIYFIVKKYPDGSIHHTKQTELFSSSNRSELRDFIKRFENTFSPPLFARKNQIVSVDTGELIAEVYPYDANNNSIAVYMTQACNNHDDLIRVIRLTSGNLRDIAVSLGQAHNCYSSVHELADRLYNSTINLK